MFANTKAFSGFAVDDLGISSRRGPCRKVQPGDRDLSPRHKGGNRCVKKGG